MCARTHTQMPTATPPPGTSQGDRLPCAIPEVLLLRHTCGITSFLLPLSEMAAGSPGAPFRPSPGTFPLTRSLGGWASTAKVDGRWHWQRVWAAWVSRVWQLSVSQSPELASLGWGKRWSETQPSSTAPPPALATAQEQVNPGQGQSQEAGSWDPQDSPFILAFQTGDPPEERS